MPLNVGTNDGQFRTIVVSCIYENNNNKKKISLEKKCFLSFITTFQTDFRVTNKTTHKGDKNRLRFLLYMKYHIYMCALISPFKIKLTLS